MRFKRARENLCRPSGTCAILPLYPALKRWAKLVHPYGAKFPGILFHRILGKLVVTHTLLAPCGRIPSREEAYLFSAVAVCGGASSLNFPIASPESTSSTRRFCCRPSAVSFDAMGSLLPKPRAST